MIAASESGSPPGTHRMSSAGTSAKLACASKRTPLMEVTGLPSSDTSTVVSSSFGFLRSLWLAQ
jgi:hypothetical protein